MKRGSNDTIRLSPNAESVIIAIDHARSQIKRTVPALRDCCGLVGRQTEAALAELMDGGLVIEAEGVYTLTDAGRRQLKSQKQRGSRVNIFGDQTNIQQTAGPITGSAVTLTGVLNAAAKTGREVTATPQGYGQTIDPVRPVGVPLEKTRAVVSPLYLSALAHPARANSAPPVRPTTDRKQETLHVHFLLAFTSLRDGLPIPIFDQDKLGRTADNQITLAHDDYLSSTQCRFLVKRSKSGAGFECSVEDLSSRNGTLVNDLPIEPHKPAPIKHGTRLTIGTTTFVLVEIPV